MESETTLHKKKSRLPQRASCRKARCDMRKIAAVIILLAGALVLFLPSLSDQQVQRQEETVRRMVAQEITYEDIKRNEVNEEAEFDYAVVEDVSVTGTLFNPDKVNKDLIVGQLVIPSIDLNIAIFRGINNTNLLAGIATMRPDQRMGQGNYPLAGHYTKNKNVLFGSLMDVKKGDIIRMTNKDTIFEYRAYDVLLVPDTAVYIIEDKIARDRGVPVISLMTCYYSSSTGQRYFVMGELVDSYPFDEDRLHASSGS